MAKFHKCTKKEYEEKCFACPWCYIRTNKNGVEEPCCESSEDLSGWNDCSFNKKGRKN